MQMLCHVLVQNEVAYEYFGDRFSVTAERTYKQVYSKIQFCSTLLHVQTTAISQPPHMNTLHDCCLCISFCS